ncbi:MAG: hydroxyisourate hydrolase [Candidatus Methylacidiphilaceae bacterium]
MSRLTTHVLDLVLGRPAQGLLLRLYPANAKELLAECQTDETGRAVCVPLRGEPLATGRYELVFAIGNYFVRTGVSLHDPPFLEEIVVRFGLNDKESDYHIPLLVTPWSYTIYRGR